MKIALVSDIHANWPALKAVLAHARERGVSTVWNLGDAVGFNAFPNKVVKRLRKEDIVSVRGNFDRKVLEVKRKTLAWEKTKDPARLFAYDWAFDNLSEKSLKFLDKLPRERMLIVAGKRVLLTHGSPARDDEALTPDTPRDRMRELAAMTKAEIVACGHSHVPFKTKHGKTWFVNPGSVGRPIDGDPRAAYAILHIKPKFVRVYFYRVEYDVERATKAIADENLPERYAQMITQGRRMADLTVTSDDPDADQHAEQSDAFGDAGDGEQRVDTGTQAAMKLGDTGELKLPSPETSSDGAAPPDDGEAQATTNGAAPTTEPHPHGTSV